VTYLEPWIQTFLQMSATLRPLFAEMAKDQEALAEVRQLAGTVGDGLEEDMYS